MSLILNIETSGKLCSVALAREGNVIAIREDPDGRSHAIKLAPFISEVLQESNNFPPQLDAVAVSKGPGSYTGLRIGVSTVKGIAYALKIPVIGINTLETMTHGLLENFPEYNSSEFLLCPIIDARRMEVYTRLFTNLLVPRNDLSALIIDTGSFREELERKKIIFFGDGVPKCKGIINHENAIFIDDFEPSARFMAVISYTSFKEGKFENLAYFEPFYLKDFVATIPRKKVI